MWWGHDARFLFALWVLKVVCGEGVLAGAHAGGAHERCALRRVLAGWDTRRQRVVGQAREGLGRRDGSRGGQRFGSPMVVVVWWGCSAVVSRLGVFLNELCWMVFEMRSAWQVCTMRVDETNAVAFSPDGKHIASGSEDMLVQIWDAENGAEVSSRFVRVC